MKNQKIQILFGVLLPLLFLSFQQVFAESSGTCGKNVKYTVSGNRISFSKANANLDAVWALKKMKTLLL